ncbi:MAG TPA: potassium channel protein [Syntrophobacter fumaroxidans]|nr:potassium channel protein [Syntrophobacter fumaroxidans]
MSDSTSGRSMAAEFSLAKEFLERLVAPAMMILCAFLFGTIGFYVIGDGRWSFFECAYMTSITLTTVGYGEVLDQISSGGRVFAMILMWSGMGVTLYAVSAITGFVVEKNLARLLKERKMERRIAALKGHILVCGAGKTGFNVLRELHSTNRSCVVIEELPDRIAFIRKHFEDVYCLQGNATEEEALHKAGIDRASGIICALNNDSDNLLITVQARYINPGIKIVARCEENNLADKFYRAGANYVVNPSFIGGMRMASEMVRPNVVSFLDRMLRGREQAFRVEEVVVGESCALIGSSLSASDIFRKTGLVPISIKRPDAEEFIYNPSQGEIIQAGMVIIVIGEPAQVSKLRQLCSD